MNFETLFVNPTGRTPRGQFIGALIPLLLAAALYVFRVKGVTGQYCLAVLLIPAIVLHARRLHDMGMTAWLLVVPAALNLAVLWAHLFNPDASFKGAISLAALVVSAGFVLWGALGKGQADANRFGDPEQTLKSASPLAT